MTPAETLHAAAVRLRELADEAKLCGCADSQHRWDVRELEDDGTHVLGETGCKMGFGFAEFVPSAAGPAQWAATMHPWLAEPLAACFEAISCAVQFDVDLIHRAGYGEALAAARVILGEEP